MKMSKPDWWLLVAGLIVAAGAVAIIYFGGPPWR